MDLSPVLNSIEKVLRFFIPGGIFWLLFALSYPDADALTYLKIADNVAIQILLMLVVGTTLYSIETTFVELTLAPIAYCFYLSPVSIWRERGVMGYHKSLACLNLEREKKKSGYPTDDYRYRWSFTHYLFILSALLIFFSYWNANESFSANHFAVVCCGGLILFIIALVSYFQMQNLEKETTEAWLEQNSNEQ